MLTTCLYRSKPCNNPRSIKDNGELHRLCMVHRVKANNAQRRWLLRKRRASSVAECDASAPKPSRTLSLAPMKRRRATETAATNTNDAIKRQRHINPAKLARPRSWSMPMTAPLAIPSSMPFTDPLAVTPMVAASAFEEEELAELGEFIVELDPSQLSAMCEISGWSSTNALENEWWLTHEPSVDGSVFCV